MSKSAERHDETSQSHDRHSFPATPKKPGRNPSNMPKCPPPPPRHTNNVNTEDSAPIDNTPITNEQYVKLMAQYQTMADNWAQHTKQLKKQQRQKDPPHSDEFTQLSSRRNESQSSSTKKRSKKLEKQTESDEVNASYTEQSKRRNDTSRKDKDHQRDLEQVIKEVRELKKIRKTSDADQEIDNDPLSLEIRSAVIPPSHRVPKEKYSGTTDPTDHVACFESTLDLYGTSDAIKCRMFPATLIGMARSWYGSLPPNQLADSDN